MFIKLTGYFVGGRGDATDYREYPLIINKSAITAICPDMDRYLKEEKIVIYTTNGRFAIVESMSKVEKLLKRGEK